MKRDSVEKKKRKVSCETMEIPDKMMKPSQHQRTGVPTRKKKKKRKAGDEIELENLSVGKRTKGTRTLDDESENNINNGNEEEEEVSLKEANAMSGKWLRKALNSRQGPQALRKFLAVCRENKESDLVADYLWAGGNLPEILRLLDAGDKKNIDDAANVFTGMHLIIMRILREFPEYRSRAEEACRRLINAHLSFVRVMLSARSGAKHRKAVLRLLTAMVSLGGNLPRELLAHLSFHSQVLESLSQMTKPNDPYSVRICYINFTLAFLIEGDAAAIRALLEKRSMLSCIFSELMYDCHTTVNLFLDTVKNWVLKNAAISKTTKLHVFSTPVLQSIVSLYNWKGPKNWPGPNAKKGERTANDSVDPREKEIAVEAVDDFLTTLLTSNRHGVIFHDRSLGTSGRKYNPLVNTVLQSLDRPWEHSKPLELVIKILAACPDLVKAQLTYTEPYLEPRASKKWIMAMRFIGRIMESIDPEYCLEDATPLLLAPPQLAEAVENLTMPRIILNSAIIRSLDNENLVIRHEGVRLLKIMLQRGKIFTEITEKTIDRTNWLTLRNFIIDYVSKNVPSLEKIIKVWNLGVESDGEADSSEQPVELIPSKLEHFNEILDLIEAHREFCPELETASIDISSAFVELRSIKLFITGQWMDEIEEADEMEDIERMKIKAIRFFLSIDVGAFAPNESLFEQTLTFLLRKTAAGGKNEIKRRETIKMLLTGCGGGLPFEACPDEMDIWIENIGDLANADEKNRIARWFVEILQKAIKNPEKYLEAAVTETEETAENNIIHWDETLFDRMRDEQRCANIGPMVVISPILCSAIENASSTSASDNAIVTKYLSLVLIEILHCQVNVRPLMRLTQKLENFPAIKYFNCWLSKGKAISMKKQVSPARYVRSRKLSKILLSSENEEKMMDRLKEIFQGCREKIEFIYGEERAVLGHDFDPYDIHRLLTMTLFYLSQFIQREQLTRETFHSHEIFIIALLHAAKNFGTKFVNKCSSLVFGHPSLVQYFSPLGPASGNNAETTTIITGGMVKIFETASRLNDRKSLPALFSPFKNKLLDRLFLAIEESKKDKGLNKDWLFPIELMAMVEPTSNQVIDLLGRIIDLPKSMFSIGKKGSHSVWANLVPKLMEILTMRRSVDSASSILDANIVKKIISHLVRSKIDPRLVGMDIWEIHLQRYLERHPRSIAAIDAHAFDRLLRASPNSTTIDLITFLTATNDQFILLFVKYICNDSTALDQSNLIFRIIASRSNYSWNDTFLKMIHDRYKNDLIRYFGEPEESLDGDWISRNVGAAAHLIERCFDGKDCEEGRARVLSNGDKLDNVDSGYVELVKNLFDKSWKLMNESREQPLTELMKVLMRITVGALKKDSKNVKKLETLCKSLMSSVESLKTKRNHFVDEELRKNHWWPQFTRFCLKLGSKVSKERENNDSGLLRTLVSLCEIAYEDAGDDQYVHSLFEMTLPRFELVEKTMLPNVKRDLAQLLLCLIRKNPRVMRSSHIPVYLAAYNGTLGETDQFILLIIQHYETNGIKLNEYRPYLWGEAGASHYSVKSYADTGLWRQPTVSQVLNLFCRHLVDETIKRFPVYRDHRPSGVCDVDPRVYDPSFYLPLLSYLLNDNNVVACHKVSQSGGLALAFAALGSTRPVVRLAACNVISRFYFHLEATGSREKYVWMRLIDSVRNTSLADINGWPIDIGPSCLVSTFLARAALVTTNPADILYPSIQSYFMAKPSIRFNTIPELLQLFHSSEPEHVAHRHWILGVVRDGMRTQLDMEVALNSVLFKMLLDFHSSLLADPITKRLVLEIIESTVKIPKAGSLLTKSYGLLAWLSQVSSNLSSRDADAVRIIVEIAREILSALERSNDRHGGDCQFLLLDVLKNVKSCLTKNTSIVCFDNYTSALTDIFQIKRLRAGLTCQDLRQLVKIGREIYGASGLDDDIIDRWRSKVETMPVDGEGAAKLRKLVLTWCGRETI